MQSATVSLDGVLARPRCGAAAPARRLAVGRDRPRGTGRAACPLLTIAGGRRRAILWRTRSRSGWLIPACRSWTPRLGCPVSVPDVPVPGVVAVPVPGLLSVLPPAGVCVPAEPCVGGNRRDGGKMSVLLRFGVAGPLGVVPSAGDPLPTDVPGDVVPGDVVPEPEPDPGDDDVCANAPVVVKPSAKIPIIAVRIPAPRTRSLFDGQRCTPGIVPAGSAGAAAS